MFERRLLSVKILVIAPHADDEVLGCGGTILRMKSEGHEVAWLLVSNVSQVDKQWSENFVNNRKIEIEDVRNYFQISQQNFYDLKYSPSKLDQSPLSEIISKLSQVFMEFEPEQLFVPFSGDAHSDHRITFDACAACMKWFRFPFIKSVLCYETMSETDFNYNPLLSVFRPNFFVNIGPQFDSKIEVFKKYKSETHTFPFPRSIEAIEALAKLRGSQSGYDYAEAFNLILYRQ